MYPLPATAKKKYIQRIKGMRQDIICGSHETAQASIYGSIIDQGPHCQALKPS